MKLIVFALAAALTSNGDLPVFDLYGKVKSCTTYEYYGSETSDGRTSNFDKDGKVIDPAAEISNEVENGKKITYYKNLSGGWEVWSEASPYGRAYDSRGRLLSRMIGYEDCSDYIYNKDGTLAKEDWGAESYVGINSFTYSSNPGHHVRIAEVNKMKSVDDKKYEVTNVKNVAFVFDSHGNWIQKFALSSTGGKHSAYIQSRKITYYDSVSTNNFKSENSHILTGDIGDEQGGMCIIGRSKGYFYFVRGNNVLVRQFTIRSFSNGKLVFDANYMNGNKLGTFSGTYSGGTLRGTFTNTKGMTVQMNFRDIR